MKLLKLKTFALSLIFSIYLFSGSTAQAVADSSEDIQSVKKQITLNAQETTLGEIIGEINGQCGVEIVGLQGRINDSVTFSAENEDVERVIKRLLRYLDENNYAFEYTRTRLKRVSVMPKASNISPHPARIEISGGETEAETKEKAVRILRINTGTQAENLDLKKDDLIIEYDGNKIQTAQELVDAVKKKTPEDNVEMVIVREQQPIRITLNGGLIGVNVLTVTVPKSELGQ